MRSCLLQLVASISLASHVFGQLPAEVSDVLDLLEQKRRQQQAVFDSEMQKANRVAIAELTKFAKAELRRNNLANAITAWQEILKIDPRHDRARREIGALKNALNGMPKQKLQQAPAVTGVEFAGEGCIQTSCIYSGQSPVIVLDVLAVPKSAGSQSVFADFNYGGLGIEIVTHDGAPKWAFACRSGDSYRKVYSQQPVTLNKPVHVTGVRNGNYMSLFIDGIRQGDWQPIPSFKRSQFPFMVGADPGKTGKPERRFTGFIESVRVLQSNVPLPHDFRPTLPLVSNRYCVLMLELNEGHGPIAADSSPKRRNAVIEGGTWSQFPEPGND